MSTPGGDDNLTDDELHTAAEGLMARLFPLKFDERAERYAVVAEGLSGLTESEVVEVVARSLSESLDLLQAMLHATRQHPALLDEALLTFGGQRKTRRVERVNEQFLAIIGSMGVDL